MGGSGQAVQERSLSTRQQSHVSEPPVVDSAVGQADNNYISVHGSWGCGTRAAARVLGLGAAVLAALSRQQEGVAGDVRRFVSSFSELFMCVKALSLGQQARRSSYISEWVGHS